MTDTILAAEVYDRLQQAMASNAEGFRELYHDYLLEARQTLGALRRAVDEGQADTFRNRAHYLKSSSAVLGVRSVSQSCTLMEEMGKNHDLSAAHSELSKVAHLLDEVGAELTRRLGPGVVPKSDAAA